MCIFVFPFVSLSVCAVVLPPLPLSVLLLPFVFLPGHIIKLKNMFNFMYLIVVCVLYFYLKILIRDVCLHLFFIFCFLLGK